MVKSRRQIASLRFPPYLTGGAFLADPVRRETTPAPRDGAARPKANPALSIFERGLERVVHAGLGQGIERIAYPGGKGRASAIVTLADGRDIIATLRDEPARAMLEYDVLMRLAGQDAPAAKPLFFNGITFLQECLTGERLPEYTRRSPEGCWPALATALDSLADLHERGSTAGLDAHGPVLGASLDWLEALFDRPRILGGWLGVSAPTCALERQIDLLTCYAPRFVKWDARGGNAIYGPDGKVGWFDFEHCGARNRLDDLVWLLADETVPDNAEAEEILLDIALERFADGRSKDEARAYIYCLGTFHVAVRLGIILYRKGDDAWGKADESLSEDRLPITLEHARTLTRRGARWADVNDATRPLSAWWTRIERALITLDRKGGRRPG